MSDSGVMFTKKMPPICVVLQDKFKGMFFILSYNVRIIQGKVACNEDNDRLQCRYELDDCLSGYPKNDE